MSEDLHETARLRAELAKTQRRLCSVLEASNDAIAGLDSDGRIVDWNVRAQQLLGWTKDEACGKPFCDLLVFPQARSERIQSIAEFLNSDFARMHDCDEPMSGGVFPRVWHVGILSKTAQRVMVALSLSPIEVEEGFHFTAVLRDRTEQIIQVREIAARDSQIKEMLQSTFDGSIDLASTQSRLELALHGGNVGLWDWNAETNHVYYSDTYKRQLGFPPETPWNHFHDWEYRVHPDDQAGALEKVRAYFAKESSEYESKFRLRCIDDSYRWFLARGEGQFAEDGTPLRMLGVHIDITQQTQDQQELERLNSALEVANDALQNSNVDLQQFAYVASHDLQTPLRAIAGFAQFLQSDYHGKIDETANKYIERIINGAKRMQKMIDDLLEYSRVESRASAFRSVSMNDVFDDAVGLLRATIDDSNAEVERDSLPSVSGDMPQLVQLIQNLIGNALKYCEGTPRIRLSARRDEAAWTFSLKDNGIGIPETQFEKIFDVFQRLHSRETYPGTGIGLAVCRRIVVRHRGKIWLDSVMGQGSTFHFTLPILQSDDGAQPS